jgi:hypothetical protein
MAVSSIVYQYFCDLCGTVTPPTELKRLRDERVLSTDRNYRSTAADVCRSCCQSKSLSILLAVIEKKRRLKEEAAR